MALIYIEENGLFTNPFEFSEFVQRWSYKNNLSAKDFILEYCEEKMIDIEDAIKLLTPTLKENIKADFNEEYNIKGENRDISDLF